MRGLFQVWKSKLQLILHTQQKKQQWKLDCVRKAAKKWLSLLARKKMKKLCEEMIVQRKRKFRFAGRVARSCDGRWSKRFLDWRPWSRIGPTAGRNVGRPVSRWTDDLINFAGSDWRSAADDDMFWRLLETGYTNKL